jgi:hypothetical protein
MPLYAVYSFGSKDFIDYGDFVPVCSGLSWSRRIFNDCRATCDGLAELTFALQKEHTP